VIEILLKGLASLFFCSFVLAEEQEGIKFLLEAGQSKIESKENRPKTFKMPKRAKREMEVPQEKEIQGFDPEEQEKKLEVGLIGGVGASSYQLSTSSGYSIKMPPAIGPFLGISAYYKKDDSLQFVLDAHEERRKFKTITGVTPGPLEVKDRAVILGARIFSGNTLYLEPFYRWKMKLVEEIKPIAVMTASQQHGIGLKLGIQVMEEGKWRNSISLGVQSPIFYKERFQRTGNSRLRAGAELENRFRFYVNRNLYLGVGAKIQGEVYTYSGRGDRSITDTRERWMLLSMPFEVGGRF